jgi:hypothetical protein
VGYCEIQMAARPGDGMAGADGGAGQAFNTSDQVRPREDFQFSFLWERF